MGARKYSNFQLNIASKDACEQWVRTQKERRHAPQKSGTHRGFRRPRLPRRKIAMLVVA
jgi:hypothetical protein